MAETRGSTQAAILSILAVEEDTTAHPGGPRAAALAGARAFGAHFRVSIRRIPRGVVVKCKHGVAWDWRSRGRLNQPTRKSMRRQDFEARIAAGREWKFRRVPQRFRFVLMRDYDPAV